MKRIEPGDSAPARRDMSKDKSKADDVPAPPMDALAPLSVIEQKQLHQCEEILSHGLNTFFDVGSALLTIREKRLYRTSHSTFETYCHERWAIGRSYACRIIGAAERLKLLDPKENIPKPSNEFQMRPFLRLEPEAFPKAWEKAIKRAKNGKVTPRLLREVVAEIAPSTFKPRVSARSSSKAMSNGAISFAELLTLLGEARLSVQQRETQAALAALEKIEWVFLGAQKRTESLYA